MRFQLVFWHEPAQLFKSDFRTHSARERETRLWIQITFCQLQIMIFVMCRRHYSCTSLLLRLAKSASHLRISSSHIATITIFGEGKIHERKWKIHHNSLLSRHFYSSHVRGCNELSAFAVEFSFSRCVVVRWEWEERGWIFIKTLTHIARKTRDFWDSRSSFKVSKVSKNIWNFLTCQRKVTQKFCVLENFRITTQSRASRQLDDDDEGKNIQIEGSDLWVDESSGVMKSLKYINKSSENW